MEPPFPAYKGDEPYIFVSYSHEDTEIAFPGVQWLRGQGFNIWYDEGISPGASWREEIAESILGCDLFIVLISPRSAHSDNCLKEVNYALEQGRPILAIHIESTQLSPGLALALSDRQAIFRHELTQEQYRDKILSGVRAHVQQSSSFAPTVPTVNANKKSWPILVGAGVVALAILAVGLLLYTKPGGEIVDSNPSTSFEHQPEAQSGESVAEPSVEIESKILNNSIAVLPFANLSPDPDNAYFAAGVHEEILNQLAKIKDLSIIARTTMLRYEKSNLSIPEIAAELNVEAIMEGSVRYADNRVRITAQLNDAKSGVHLWSETYDRDFKDIFAIQSDIAVQITNAMKAEFELEERLLFAEHLTDNADAYSHYVKAQALFGATPPDLPNALLELGKAIELDPNFASAMALRALIQGYFAFFASQPEAQEENIALAKEFAQQALEIDPNQGNAYAALSLVSQIERRWQSAFQNSRKAYELSPNYATAFQHATWLNNTGLTTEALNLFNRAVALDPLNHNLPRFIAPRMLIAGDFINAYRFANQARVLEPGRYENYLTLAQIDFFTGDLETAIQNVEKSEALVGDQMHAIHTSDLMILYHRLGRPQDVQRLYKHLIQLDKMNLVNAANWALAYTALGDIEKGLDYLHQVVDDNFPALIIVDLHAFSDSRIFDPWRGHPRFDEVLEKIKASSK